jgi:hypothetical protein
MGKSCTKAAGLALAKAEKALCVGRSSNVYRLDDLTEKGLQVIIESWKEQDDGGIRFDLLKDNQDGTADATPLATVTIDGDGNCTSGPLYWHKAVNGQKLTGILPPNE